MAKKFPFAKAPYLRSADSGKTTNRMMIDVLIALTPLIIFSFVKNGILPFAADETNFWGLLRPLLFILSGGLMSILAEGLWFYFVEKITNFKELLKTVWLSYGVIVGLLLAMVLPLNTPFYALWFGCIMGNIVFKMLFGGFGHNVFNPALIAYAIVMVSFGGFTTMNPIEIVNNVSATPLGVFRDGMFSLTQAGFLTDFGNFWNFFLGTIPGAVAETSSMFCVLAFVYLVIRKTINWRVPVIYVGTVFVLFLTVGLINDLGVWYPLYQVLSGGLLFGAVFMATEPVTTPRTPNGKVIFAIGLGVLTVLMRLYGKMVEGVATSILFMGLFVPVIDRIAAKLRAEKFSYKVILKYLAFVSIFVLVALYVILRSLPNGGIE